MVRLWGSMGKAPVTSHQQLRIEGKVALPQRSGARRGEAKAWAAAENAKGHVCACGCGGRISVHRELFKTGVPKYMRGHRPRQ